MKKLYEKYKELIHYLFFGGATTAVNWVVYGLLVELMGADITLSNALAWAAAVLFAFVNGEGIEFIHAVTTDNIGTDCVKLCGVVHDVQQFFVFFVFQCDAVILNLFGTHNCKFLFQLFIFINNTIINSSIVIFY